MATIYPVIMCGGAGSRMWPLSRQATPKQYLSLIDEHTLLGATVARMAVAPSSMSVAATTLICGKGQETIAAEQAEAAGSAPLAVIVEPFGRNTAAVAATAAAFISSIDTDGVVLLLPADHFMSEPKGFWDGVIKALVAADVGDLVTLGIEPAGPETGYGYIQSGERVGDDLYRIDSFREKPDRTTAEAYLAAGDYYWNAGIFLFRADAMIREFETLGPDILGNARVALEQAGKAGIELHLDPDAFGACRAEPVDIEIMERTKRGAVVAPVCAGWDDIGSWAALADLLGETANGIAPDRGDVLRLACEGGMVRSEGPFVAAIGLTDIVIVATADAVLVTHKEHAQRVKSVVETLEKSGRTDLL